MRRSLVVLLGIASFGLAACGDGGDGGDPPATNAAKAKPAAVANDPAINDWALKYVEGKAGKADASLSPVTIGYINQEDSVPAFPEVSVGMDAAVEYANAELGGADGHPIKLKKCVVHSEEDGQKCAVQMANDPEVKFVQLGVTAVGQKAIYSVLTGKKPIISTSPSTVDDLAAKDAYAYTSGGPGVIAGMGVFAAMNLKALGRVAVVAGDNPAAKQSSEQFLKPLLLKLGVKEVKLVAVADNATGPDVASALQAVGADQADALLTFVTVPGCIAIYDGLRSLGISPRVVATGLCFGTPMTKHLKDLGQDDPVPDGWYFANYGYSYYQPDEASGMKTYLAKIRQYGGDDVEYTGFAGYAFADLLTSVRFVNEIGADDLTSAALRAKAKAFTGPMMIGGAQKCGYSKMFAALCGKVTGVEQYKGKRWLPSALADQSIDVSKILGG